MEAQRYKREEDRIKRLEDAEVSYFLLLQLRMNINTKQNKNVFGRCTVIVFAIFDNGYKKS